MIPRRPNLALTMALIGALAVPAPQPMQVVTYREGPDELPPEIPKPSVVPRAVRRAEEKRAKKAAKKLRRNP